jgi:hypothetical protein
MTIRIKPTSDEVELSAVLEVTKTVAFYALLTAILSLSGDRKAKLEKLELALKQFFKSCQIDLPLNDAERFREHARATIDELLERVDIDNAPFKSPQRQ